MYESVRQSRTRTTKQKVPQEGGRGFVLAKWAWWAGMLVIISAQVHLYLGTLDADGYVTTLLLGSGLCGVGPAGHQVSNTVERIGINKRPTNETSNS